MHQTAMCCTDADRTGLHTNTYLLTFKHTFEQSHVTALQSKSGQDKANEDRLVRKVESGLFYPLRFNMNTMFYKVKRHFVLFMLLQVFELRLVAQIIHSYLYVNV